MATATHQLVVDDRLSKTLAELQGPEQVAGPAVKEVVP
jgi:hypothetical protein